MTANPTTNEIAEQVRNDDVEPFSHSANDNDPCDTPKLPILHLSHDEFLHSIRNPRPFPTAPAGRVMAGVVPHHNVASVLISGFFSMAAAYDYDLVIILAPNHAGCLTHVTLSDRHWDIGQGAFTHQPLVYALLAESGINTAISHYHMAQDHAASILIPYIYHYLPGAQVAPLLLSRTLNFGETEALFHWLYAWIASSGKNVLLVASIDFSHFLPIPMAWERDAVTKDAILAGDLQKIHHFSDHHLDSPAAMIIWLMYLEALGIRPQILAHTDASEFLGPGLDETTSYMVIAGALPAAAERETTRVQLTFTGDIMLHQAQANAAFCAVSGTYCFHRSFDAVGPFLQSADLAIGNLETVLGGHFMDTGFTQGPFPRFSAPDEFAHALQAAGFDLLSTANNHALDQGVDGLLRTLDVLDSLGIGTFGAYATQAARDTPLVREVGGIRFAFLSYTFGTNGNALPPGRGYLVNLMHQGQIQADIARAQQVADIVIVMPHMGYEYETSVRPAIQNWAKMMIAAGADVVVAGHPHVVQPMGFVDVVCDATGATRTGFIAYCLGNFISSQRQPGTDTGVMLNLYFERVAGEPPVLAGFSYVPTWVKFTDAGGNTDIRVLPIVETLAAVDAGEDVGLRQVDIARMREALREVEGLLR
ncbi:MAG: AmmeMemoRadiSam system protein B [Defluviitaleaceae bacterium]|nr:AmmeMemoRadiSam system protein B [Defluviitaleaceae bacterium]